MRLSELGELGLLAELERRGLAREIENDAAQLSGGRVVTNDVLVQEVHFRLEWTSYRDLGYRAAAVNLSDLAASGAEPEGLIVGLGAPPETPLEDVIELYEGLNEPGVPILGGDTTASERLFLSVTALGRSERVPGRAGARPGDLLVVTGPLGAAGAAFREQRHYARRSVSTRAGGLRPVPTRRSTSPTVSPATQATSRAGPAAASRSSSNGSRWRRAPRSPISASARTTSSCRRHPTRSNSPRSAAVPRARASSSCSRARASSSAAGNTSPRRPVRRLAEPTPSRQRTGRQCFPTC